MTAEETLASEMLISSQPVLWAQAMLDEAEKVSMPDARAAILSRVGMTLLGTFGITLSWDEMRRVTRGAEESAHA